jgi:hypothetical protein
MLDSTLGPFPADALDANRRGELSESQRRGFGALSARNRRSALSGAAFLVAGALVIIFFASPTASPTLRMLIPLVALAIAGFVVVRSVTGSDALTRDLREGRVESVEGAIGKRRVSSGGGGRSVTTYFLDVGDRSFRVMSGTYEAAPDAGMVRLYFLPGSRKVVNLERLANPPAPTDLSPKGIASLLGTAFGPHSRREQNEARAGIASFGEAVQAAFSASAAAPPPGTRDSRPLAAAIVGTWTNGFITVTFSSDGAITTRMPHGEIRGRWSVDDAGRLNAEIAGRQQAAEAWITGHQLTIAAEGSGLTLRREGSA